MATNLRREIGPSRRHAFLLETRIRQRMAGTAEQICAKFTRKTCLVLRSDEFECQYVRSKVKVTRNKNALCTHNTPVVWTEWNALVADNVAQAAGATIRSLQRGAGMRALGLAGYRWALPRISITNQTLSSNFICKFHRMQILFTAVSL